VSVAAADCAQANIAATAAIVRGRRAARWLAELGLPARLAGWDGSVHTVGKWPQQRATSAAGGAPASLPRGFPAGLFSCCAADPDPDR